MGLLTWDLDCELIDGLVFLHIYLYHHQFPLSSSLVQLVSFKFFLNVDGNCLLENKRSSYIHLYNTSFRDRKKREREAIPIL